MEEMMSVKSATHWCLVVAVLALDIGATAPAQAAPPTVISLCPYTISAPGNYVVQKNLSATGTCIAIAADNVALDLQRNVITGNGHGYGIVCGGGVTRGCNRVVVTDGTITRFAAGVLLE